MHLQILKPSLPFNNSSTICPLPRPLHENPRKKSNLFRSFSPFLIRNCNSNCIAVADSKSTTFPRCGGEDEKVPRNGAKPVDLVTLGNLCVDVVLNVPKLPPDPLDERLAYMEDLAASRPDKKYWEAGGSCNLAIAAARLGLGCISLGHVGNEIYGRFLLDVLLKEGIAMVGMDGDTESSSASASASYETLLCWVLVDPMQRHGFCSRADFSKDPAFSWMTSLSVEVKTAIKKSKTLFCNGYVFDELSPGLIGAAVEYALDVGTAVFFDPGPRGKTLLHGTLEQQRALQLLLKMSDVLLLTSDEAYSLTGIANPGLAAEELIRKGVRTKWVVVKLGPKGSILITRSTVSCVPAFKVNVVDTVGCGDSFSAAIVFGFLRGIPAINALALANAVGAATAMGCGAGRNVANVDKVMELLKGSNLNEDERMWNKVVDDNPGKEVRVVSKRNGNGTQNRESFVSMQSVVSELLASLEMCARRNKDSDLLLIKE